MKKIIAAIAAIAVAFTMASCEKEQLVEPGCDITGGNCVITAYTESNIPKTSLSGNDSNGYDVIWSKGDKITIGGNIFELTTGDGTTKGTFRGTLPKDGTSYTAYYPSTYDGSTWPTEQTYTKGNITGSPMSAEAVISDGKIAEPLSFRNVGGILRLTVKGIGTVKSIKVAVNGLEVITLMCGDGVALDNTNGTVFHIALPYGTYPNAEILISATDRKFCLKTLKSDKPLTINRSEITAASIKIDKWSNNSQAPDGALSGIFTVSADGKKVYFSRGNLYYGVSEFGFATDQLSLERGELSHFYWSKNADQACQEEYNEYPFVSGDDVLFTNADYESPNPDFTANGQKGLWRTLSEAEWSYLASNSSIWATIKGVNGLVIFCDGYTGSRTGPFTEIPEGCAFLPAAGYRDPNSYNVSSAGNEGHYLTSEPYSNYKGDYAWLLDFDSDVAMTGICERDKSGSCVRLVTDVTEDVTFTISFNMNGHGPSPAKYIGVPYRTTISKPADPVAEGYTFWGWYKDEACTSEWNFDSDLVTSNSTLYATRRINGALSGSFTVNRSGKKVYFSKGNLWCDYKGLFNFEEDQFGYSVRWDEESGYFMRDDLHVSHFMWSKNADVARNQQYDDPNRSAKDALFTNATQTTPNPNFTVNGQKGLWRALSKEEWTYLINNNGSVWATINEVRGRIIFCDGYSGEKEGEFTEIPEGCLFLPAAGWRDGVNELERLRNCVSNLGEKGFYLFSALSDIGYAYKLEFNSSNISSSISVYREEAFAIRLVTEVK